jgi:hypothetical protein
MFNNRIKKIMKKIYLTLTLLFCFGAISAQSSKDYQANIPDYSNNGIDPVPFAPPPPPNPIPIDGGIGFLLTAGVGYGLKRMRKRP